MASKTKRRDAPPALERGFIASPVGWGHRIRSALRHATELRQWNGASSLSLQGMIIQPKKRVQGDDKSFLQRSTPFLACMSRHVNEGG